MPVEAVTASSWW